MITNMPELLAAIRTGHRVVAQRTRLTECRELITDVQQATSADDLWEQHPTKHFIGPRANGRAGLFVVLGPQEAIGQKIDDHYGEVHPRIRAAIGKTHAGG